MSSTINHGASYASMPLGQVRFDGSRSFAEHNRVGGSNSTQPKQSGSSYIQSGHIQPSQKQQSPVIIDGHAIREESTGHNTKAGGNVVYNAKPLEPAVRLNKLHSTEHLAYSAALSLSQAAGYTFATQASLEGHTTALGRIIDAYA